MTRRRHSVWRSPLIAVVVYLVVWAAELGLAAYAASSDPLADVLMRLDAGAIAGLAGLLALRVARLFILPTVIAYAIVKAGVARYRGLNRA